MKLFLKNIYIWALSFFCAKPNFFKPSVGGVCHLVGRTMVGVTAVAVPKILHPKQFMDRDFLFKNSTPQKNKHGVRRVRSVRSTLTFRDSGPRVKLETSVY